MFMGLMVQMVNRDHHFLSLEVAPGVKTGRVVHLERDIQNWDDWQQL
jgi:hypothetical protein